VTADIQDYADGVAIRAGSRMPEELTGFPGVVRLMQGPMAGEDVYARIVASRRRHGGWDVFAELAETGVAGTEGERLRLFERLSAGEALGFVLLADAEITVQRGWLPEPNAYLEFIDRIAEETECVSPLAVFLSKFEAAETCREKRLREAVAGREGTVIRMEFRPGPPRG
jgi:hypothetical protein